MGILCVGNWVAGKKQRQKTEQIIVDVFWCSNFTFCLKSRFLVRWLQPATPYLGPGGQGEDSPHTSDALVVWLCHVSGLWGCAGGGVGQSWFHNKVAKKGCHPVPNCRKKPERTTEALLKTCK